MPKLFSPYRDQCIPVLKAEEIRRADQLTIEQTPISSLDLMENAAILCTQAIVQLALGHHYHIVVGAGNNGGDGLAIARMLLQEKFSVTLWMQVMPENLSADGQANWLRLQKYLSCGALTVHFLQNEKFEPHQEGIIIDALLGTGVDRPLQGDLADTVKAINASALPVIAIDLPSGLPADRGIKADFLTVIAHYTLSIGAGKYALLDAENQKRLGQWCVLDIHLTKQIEKHLSCTAFINTRSWFEKHIKPRPRHCHKGCFGHALLFAGSQGSMGAAVLAARACLSSGIGKLTVKTNHKDHTTIHTAVPEAMLFVDDEQNSGKKTKPNIEVFDVFAIGPGIGQSEKTAEYFFSILEQAGDKKCIIDADGLNILSKHKEYLSRLPSHTLLTPHLKEFSRLTGENVIAMSFSDRLHLASHFSRQYRCILLLKDDFTLLTDGEYQLFNSRGTPGLAKAGSGDVLTGIILGLSGQYESLFDAAALGVYAHALAGEQAANVHSEMGMTASDVLSELKKVWACGHHSPVLNRLPISLNLTAY